MEKWYFTFGCGQKNENHYVEILAVNGQEAGKGMFRKYGRKWCGQYSEEQWNRSNNLCNTYKRLERLEAYKVLYT